MSRLFLLLLMGAYFPFLAASCLAAGAVGAFLIWWGYGFSNGPDGSRAVVGYPVAFLGGALLLSAVHVVFGLRALFHKEDDKDDLEFELPDQWQEGLSALVAKVAEDRGLPVPDIIRIHAADVAKVYNDRKGRMVLVIGGVAVAALPRRALAGIIAHELGHLHGGDTALSRSAMKWHLVMVQLEGQFARVKAYQANPLAWAIRLYHRVYFLVWFGNMRSQEYAADAHEVEHVGEEKAAATLVLVEALHTMAGVSLVEVAESFVETNQRLDQLFAEQVRRVRTASVVDWEKALRKGLRATTGWFDTHPCLKERLGALGVSPKKALKLAMDLSGEPATTLFANWPVVEKFLTKKILEIVREIFRQKQEIAETFQTLTRWQREQQRAADGE